MKKIFLKKIVIPFFLFTITCLPACNSGNNTAGSDKVYKNVSLKDWEVVEEDQVYVKETAVKFIANPDWEAVKKLAKEEKKGILVYGYGSGCPGCEFYKKRIFVSDSIADYIQDNYIPLVANLNVSANSKNPWHIKIRELIKENRLVGFPQVLLLNAEGIPITRFMTVGAEPQSLIKKLEWTKEEQHQYYVKLARFNEETATLDELKEMIQFAKDIYDKEIAEKLIRVYLRTEKDIFRSDAIYFIGGIIASPRDTGVQIILNNIDRIEKLQNGYKAIRRALHFRISNKFPYTSTMKMDDRDGKTVGDDIYIQQIEEAFPNYKKYAEELVMNARLRSIYREQKSPLMEAYTLDYLNKYGKKIDYETVMTCIWDLAPITKKDETMKELEKWADYLLAANYKNVNTIGVKAYILKKSGKVNEAKALIDKEIHLITVEAEREHLYKIINGTEPA